MFNSRLPSAAGSADLSAASGPSVGELDLVREGFERICSPKRGLRLDEDPAIIDGGLLQAKVHEHLRFFATFQLNATAQFGGAVISRNVGMLCPGEGPTSHGLVEIFSKEGRPLCLVEPRFISVTHGVVLHHVTAAPGMSWRPMEPLFSPRAFEAEILGLVEATQSAIAASSLEERSILYCSIRSNLAGLREGWIPVTRPLKTIESVGEPHEPAFRLVCGDHRSVVVDVRYSPETCQVGYEVRDPLRTTAPKAL